MGDLGDLGARVLASAGGGERLVSRTAVAFARFSLGVSGALVSASGLLFFGVVFLHMLCGG
mgnify:CR=1 FL=1